MSLALFSFGSCAHADSSFHTRPNCWDKPRIYTPLNKEDDYRIVISRVDSASAEPRSLSPNEAYAFHLSDAIFDEDTQSFRREVFVFAERPYLLKFTFPDVRDINEVRWINERLLYVRAWRGRIAGSDSIIDVESERVIHQEPFIWGSIVFEQFKQCSKEPRKSQEQCQCMSSSGTTEEYKGQVTGN